MRLPRCTMPSLFASTLVVISLSVGQFSRNAMAFHPTSKYFRGRHLDLAPRSSCLWSSSPGMITADPNVKVKLESMTVKQLKDLLKESKLNERGVLSKLKLKQDLVEFLADNLGSSSSSSEAANSAAVNSRDNGQHKAAPDVMVDVDDTIITEEVQAQVEPPPPTNNDDDGRIMPTNNNNGQISSTKRNGAAKTKTAAAAAPLGMPSKKSSLGTAAKDAIFARVYQRYPPVLEQVSTEDEENNDIRQQYHPIFKHLPKSCDMDVAFVGTASCMPGITRGVSCTALRLNWQRQSFPRLPSSLARNLPSNSAGAAAAAQSTFVGGTWLFDCGECTQVSSVVLMGLLFVMPCFNSCQNEAQRRASFGITFRCSGVGVCRQVSNMIAYFLASSSSLPQITYYSYKSRELLP
jgi:hypothetical protein